MSKLYSHLFASSYDYMSARLEKSLERRRADLLSDLSGKVLDLGAGTGVNFKFFSDGTQLVALDPSPTMIEIARAKAPKDRNITFINEGIDSPVLFDKIPKGSLDVVVSTLVLCSVPNPISALSRIKQLLKPGGMLVVMEHIHATRPLNKIVQRVINPAWKVCGDGCNLTRDTDKLIRESGFQVIREDYFKRTLRFYQGVFKTES